MTRLQKFELVAGVAIPTSWLLICTAEFSQRVYISEAGSSSIDALSNMFEGLFFGTGIMTLGAVITALDVLTRKPVFLLLLGIYSLMISLFFSWGFLLNLAWGEEQ